MEGDRGAEGVPGRQEERGREAVLLRWRDAGEIEENFAILRNSRAYCGTKRPEPLREGAGNRSKRYGRWESQTLLSPHFLALLELKK